jgi:hypothetical protein
VLAEGLGAVPRALMYIRCIMRSVRRSWLALCKLVARLNHRPGGTDEASPCWPDHTPCPDSFAQALYDREVYNRQYLPAPWQGWRFAGCVLVSPEGDRIAPERLQGLLWREQTRLASAESPEAGLQGGERVQGSGPGAWSSARGSARRGWVKRHRRGALSRRPSRLTGLINMVVQLPQQIERAGQAHPFQRLVSMLLGCCAPLVTHTGFGHAGAGMRTSC